MHCRLFEALKAKCTITGQRIFHPSRLWGIFSDWQTAWRSFGRIFCFYGGEFLLKKLGINSGIGWWLSKSIAWGEETTIHHNTTPAVWQVRAGGADNQPDQVSREGVGQSLLFMFFSVAEQFRPTSTPVQPASRLIFSTTSFAWQLHFTSHHRRVRGEPDWTHKSL